MPGATTQVKNVDQTEVLAEAMSRPMLQQGSALNSVAQLATKTHTEAQGLGQSLLLGWSRGREHVTIGAIQICVTCTTTCGQGVIYAQAATVGHV